MRRLARDAKRLQVLRAVTIRHCVGDIGKRLGRLTNGNGRDHFIGQCIDGSEGISILSPIDPRSIA